MVAPQQSHFPLILNYEFIIFLLKFHLNFVYQWYNKWGVEKLAVGKDKAFHPENKHLFSDNVPFSTNRLWIRAYFGSLLYLSFNNMFQNSILRHNTAASLHAFAHSGVSFLIFKACLAYGCKFCSFISLLRRQYFVTLQDYTVGQFLWLHTKLYCDEDRNNGHYSPRRGADLWSSIYR
jgi:hypothetical protein